MAYTFDNTRNTYRKRAVASYTPDYWIGCHLTGRTTGATGILVNRAAGFDGGMTHAFIFLLTATDFGASEVCDILDGGTITLTAAAGLTNTKNTIQASGTLDTDTTRNTTLDVGSVGTHGGKLVTTLVTALNAVTATGWDDPVTFTDGSTIAIGNLLLIDDEIVMVRTKPTANTATIRRCWRNINKEFPGPFDAHAIGANVYRVGIKLDSVTGINPFDYIRIDDEYMYVLGFSDSDDIFALRGQLGSTIADHNQPKDVYKIDDAFFYQCYKASVDGGWGYDSLVNGRLNLNCNIIVGNPNASAITIAHSAREAVEITGSYTVIGRDQTTKRTWLHIGCGDVSDEKTAINGSNIQVDASDTNCIAEGMSGTQFGTLNILASGIGNPSGGVTHYDGGAIVRSTVNCQPSVIQGDGYMKGLRDTTWRDIIITGQGANPSSARMIWGKIVCTDTDYAFYFVYGFVEPEIFNVTIQRCNYDAFAFIDGLRKTFVNSMVNVLNMTGYWASPVYVLKSTIDASAITEKNIAIDNLNIKMDDSTGAEVVNEDTGADGTIAQQKVELASFDMNTWIAVDNNPFKVITKKAGWKDKDFFVTIVKSLTGKADIYVMENAGLTEDEN